MAFFDKVKKKKTQEDASKVLSPSKPASTSTNQSKTVDPNSELGKLTSSVKNNKYSFVDPNPITKIAAGEVPGIKRNTPADILKTNEQQTGEKNTFLRNNTANNGKKKRYGYQFTDQYFRDSKDADLATMDYREMNPSQLAKRTLLSIQAQAGTNFYEKSRDDDKAETYDTNSIYGVNTKTNDRRNMWIYQFVRTASEDDYVEALRMFDKEIEAAADSESDLQRLNTVRDQLLKYGLASRSQKVIDYQKHKATVEYAQSKNTGEDSSVKYSDMQALYNDTDPGLGAADIVDLLKTEKYSGLRGDIRVDNKSLDEYLNTTTDSWFARQDKIRNAVQMYLDQHQGDHDLKGKTSDTMQAEAQAKYDKDMILLNNKQDEVNDYNDVDAYFDRYKTGNEEHFHKVAYGFRGGYTPGKYGQYTTETDDNGVTTYTQTQPTIVDAVFDPNGVENFTPDQNTVGDAYTRTTELQTHAGFTKYMSGDQQDMFSYIYRHEGEEAAEEYLKKLENTYLGQAKYNALDQALAEATDWRNRAGATEDGAFWKDTKQTFINAGLLTAKAVSTLLTPLANITSAGMQLRGDEVGRFDPSFDIMRWQNATVSGVASHATNAFPLGELPKEMGGGSVSGWMVQNISSTLDNLVQELASMGVGAAVGATGKALEMTLKAGTLSIMANQVFAQKLYEGYSDPSKSEEQIWADAAFASVIEIASETVLPWDQMAESSMFVNGGSFKKLLGTMIAEGGEEMSSDFMNACYAVVSGNEIETEQAFKQYLADYNGDVEKAAWMTIAYVAGHEFMSFAGGATSAGASGVYGMATNAIKQNAADYKAGNDIYQRGDRSVSESLRMIMKANDPSSKEYKSAEKMLKRMTDNGFDLENMSDEDKINIAGIQQEADKIEAEQDKNKDVPPADENKDTPPVDESKDENKETPPAPVEENKDNDQKPVTEENKTEDNKAEENSEETPAEDEEKQNDPVEDVKRFFDKNRKNVRQLGKIFRKTMNTISGQFSDALQAANAEKVQSLLANDEGSKDISKVVVDSLIAIANENATADQVDAVEAWTETHPDSIVTGIVSDIYNRENGFAPSAYTGEAAKKAQIYKDLFLSPYAKGTAEFALNTLRFATDKATAAASAIANAVGDSVAGRIGRVNKEGTTQVVSPDGHSTDIKSLPTEYKVVDGVLSGKTEINGVETYVAVDSLVGANDTEGAMIGAITAYSGQDANVANAISAGAKAFGSDIAAYVHALDNAQKYGFYGLTEGRVMEMVGTDNKAVNDAIKAVWSKATEARNAVNKAQRNRVGKGSGKIDDSRINGKKLNHVQENAIGVLKAFADTGSVNVRLFDSTKDSAMVDGQYDPNTNTISIDISAGLDAKDSSSVAGQMIAKVFSHELTHYIQSNNADGYQTLVNVLNDALRNGGKESFNALVNNRLAAYERRQNDILERKAKGEQISKEDQKFIEKGTVELEMLATDEAVANACEFMLRDSKVVQEVAENVYKKDAGLAQKILDLINKFVERVKNAFNAYSKAVGSEEAKALAETGIKNIEAVQKAWDDALRTAMKNAIGNVQQFAGTMSNAVSVVEAVQQAEEQKADYPAAESNAVEANVQTPEWAEYTEAEPLKEIAKEVQENGRIRDEVIPEIDINPDSVELRTTSINGKNYIVPAVTVPYSGVHIDIGLDRAYDESTSVFLNDFKALRPMARIAAQEVLNDTENRIAPQTYMVDSDAANAVLGQSVMRVGAVRSPMMAWITSRQRMGKNGQPLKVKGEGKLGVSGIGWSYDQIRKNMQKLIDCIDKGVEIPNTKSMKIAEVICDKVITEGFEHIDYAASPCMEYIMLKAQIEGTERNGFGNERTMNDPAFKNAIDFWAGLGVDRAELFGTKVSINQLYELNEAGKLSDDNMRTVLKQSGYAEEYENMIDFELDTDDLKAAVKGVLEQQRKDIPAEYHDDKELGYRIMSREFMGIKEAEVRNSSKIDQDYMAAVEADDMETAQKLVDEAARKAGYTDRMYHGTPYGTFNKFREWSYFTANKDYADRYQNPSASSIRGRYESATNQRTYSVYVKADNAFDTREDEAREVFYNEFYRQWGNGTDLQDSGLPDWVDGSDLVEFFEENDYDYDAVFLDEGADGGYGEEVVKRGISMMVKDSAQIKSADPVTRDDNGNVIPLSERFNSDKADIRYSSKDIEELKDYPTSGLRFKRFDLYTNEQQNTIKRYLEGVDESILEYFKKYTDGLDVSKPINFGTPSNSVVDAAMRIHGIDVSEYAYEMNKYACEHIEFRHGESGESNTTMNDENDVARMKWVIENADNSYEGRPTRAYSEPKFEGSKYSRKARTIVFEKAVDGTVMVVIAAPVSQRKVLGIVTAFVNTKKTVEPNGYTNNSTPELYAQSDDQQSSANSITYDNLNINSNTDKAEENYVDEAETRDSEKASTLTDRDLLRMASDAVAQTETEREYLKMYRESTGEMSKLNDMIEGERENIERYKKAGNTAEVTKATNRLNVLQQQFDRAVEKSSKLEESKPLAGVMFRIRQDTEAAVLDALTQVRDAGTDVQAAIDAQVAKYKDEVRDLKSRISKLKAENKAHTQKRDNAKVKTIESNESVRQLEAALESTQNRLAALQQKYAKDIANEVQKRENALSRMRSQREASATRKKIRRIIDNFNARLTKPNANKYIPVDMVRGIVEALDSFDMSYVRNGEEKVSAKVAQMKGVYDALKQDGTYQFMHDGVISEMLTKLQETMGDTPFRNLTNEQLDQVYEVMKSLHKTITEATQLKAGEYARNIFDAVKNMIEETDAADPALKGRAGEFVNWQLTPMRAFRRFGGYAKNSTWESVGKTFVKAEEKYYEVQRTAQEFFQDLTEKKDFENLVKYNDKDLVDVGLTDMHTGKAVKITRGMMLSIYMHLANEDNRGGIMRGGFTIPGMKDYYSGRQKRAFSTAQMRTAGISQKFEEIRQQMFKDGQINEQLGEDAYQTLEDQANAELDAMRDVIASKMTDFEKKLVERVHEWNDNMSRNMLNEVTMDIYGFKKAAVDNYYPIHRDSDFLEGNFDSIKRDYNLENVGFLKERVKASQPIMLTDICYEMSGSINGVARYVGYVRAQRDFNKLYSGRLPGMTKSVKNSIAKKFGAGNQAMGVTGAQYIDNLMQDIIGSRARSEDSIFAAIRRNLPRATLSANVRVALSQLASIPTAAAALDFRSVTLGTMQGLKIATSKDLKNELASKSVWFWQRYRGEGGMVEFQDMKSGGNIVDRAYNKFNKVTKGKILNWCQATDVMATSMMYRMSEIWVKNHTDLHEGTDEFKAAVDEKYSEVLLETQPMYTTTGRSDLLRGTNEVMKMFTMYKTQANQNFNILYDANANFRKMKQDLKNGVNGVTQEDVHKAGAKLAHSIAAVGFVAPAVYAVLRFVGNAIMYAFKKYKDKDDEITLESVLMGITNEAAGSIASMVVMGGDIYNLAYARITDTKYWGMEDSAIGKIGDIVYSLGNDDLSNADKRAKLAENIASAAGIPWSNAKSFYNSAAGWIKDLQTEEWFDGVHTDNTYISRMVDAAISNDVDRFTSFMEDLTASGLEQSKIDSKFVNKVKDRYENGKIDQEKAERLLIDYAGKNSTKAHYTVEGWNYKAAHGKDAKYDMYDDLRKAVTAKDDTAIMDAYNDLVSNGVKDETVSNKIASFVEEGIIGKDDAIELMVKMGKKEESAYWAVDKASYKASNDGEDDGYSRYIRLEDALASGNESSINTALNEIDMYSTTSQYTAVMNSVMDLYAGGKIDWNKAEELLKKYGLIKQKKLNDTLYWFKEEGDYLMDHPGESFDKYDKFYNAIEQKNANDIASAAKELMAHGETKKTIGGKLKSKYADKYKRLYNNNPVEAERLLVNEILPAFKAIGYGEAQERAIIKKDWLDLDRHGYAK